MTSSFLQSELTSLISDSKRKFGDVKIAAEKSLGDLKGITVTSESQLAADLARRPAFIDPFLLACQTKNAKLANSATNCLQRLIASKAVSTDKLGDVLGALHDVMSASYDVQLKILQTLPALLQLYSSQIHGEYLARTLEICAFLQGSKTPLVSSSAGATLSQLITSVFEQADRQTVAAGRPDLDTVDGDQDGKDTPASADDAAQLFQDLCSALNRTEPAFVRIDNLSSTFLIEILQKVIDDNSKYIRSRPELVEVCQKQLVPAISTLLESVEDPYLLVLLFRISSLSLVTFAPTIFADMRPIFNIALKFTDRDSPLWKRAIVLEFLAQLFANFGLLARLFDDSKNESDNFVIKSLATFVRIASEDPVLIGLGRQSTMPAQQKDEIREDDMAAIEAQGVNGLASVSSADASATGISIESSTLETRLLDTFEPATVGQVPKTYPYTLILESISAFCDGLSKFIMPLSVMAKVVEDKDDESDAEDGRGDQSMTRSSSMRQKIQKHKYQRLINPLKISGLPQQPQIIACSEMVDSCWPAILAMCSTFLNAALDSHFYHILIRAMQKLAQVSGTLELSTPRDALLTSLAKGSIPANATSFLQLASPLATRERDNDPQEPRTPVKSPPADVSRPSLDGPRQGLNVRHLLCLRALLNLGIALGPTLVENSWFIVIETLQQAEALIAIASAGRVSQGVGQEGQNITSEISAVNTAAKKMFESTRSYTDSSFGTLVCAVLRLIGDSPQYHVSGGAETVLSPATAVSPGALASPTVAKHGHKISRSVSGLWAKTKALDVEVAFAFTKLKELSRLNIYRFANTESEDVTWKLVVARLLAASQSEDLSHKLRLQAASIVDSIAMEVIKLIRPDEMQDDESDAVQCLCLKALADQMDEQDAVSSPALSLEITKRMFEALEDILGHSGESLRQGWTIVFQILRQSFPSQDEEEKLMIEALPPSTPVAFRCVQLVCTDFVELLQFDSLDLLVSLLFLFGSQQHDTNMALTTTGLLRNIAALLQHRSQTLDISEEDLSSGEASDQRAANPKQLWCAALNELAKMCSDSRKDVRDASIRILLQTIDAASSQLTPSGWNVLLDASPFAILQDYQAALSQEGIDRAAVSSSAAHLTERLTKLLAENMSAIAQGDDFSDTWSGLMDIFNVMLDNGGLETFSLVHICVSQLLSAISQIDIDRSSLVKNVLMLWAWHPVPEQHEERDLPNQAALSAHLHTLTQAYATCPTEVRRFTHHRRKISEYATTAVRKSLLTAIHPPYTNDIKTMTSDQQEAMHCLEIIRVLLANEMENFCGFTLELIQDMLDIEKGSLKPPPEQTPGAKKSQKPTHIAVSSHCIDLLRQVAEQAKDRPDYASVVQLPYALDMLSAIIKTKYTSIPTNAVAPIWRNATATAVVLLEGTRPLSTLNEDIADVAQTITATLTAMLASGGLSTSSSNPPSADTLLADEAFDSAHALRFHHAAIPIISTPELSVEARRKYILAVFTASLFYTPWHGDLPSDSNSNATTSTTPTTETTPIPSPSMLLTNPLANLSSIRPSTTHTPTPLPRQAIPFVAMDALFALLDPEAPEYTPVLAIEATPYVLLRTALPLKSFLADQKLRGLTPMGKVMQAEMVGVLERVIELRVDDGVVGRRVGGGVDGEVGEEEEGGEINDSGERMWGVHAGGEGMDGKEGKGDGKAHLRVLYGLVLKVQKEWKGAMRVPGGFGWMDVEGGEGRKVERLLQEWIERVGEGWGI